MLPQVRRQNTHAAAAAHGLEDFLLFCPKWKYACVIRFKNGKTEEIKMPDA